MSRQSGLFMTAIKFGGITMTLKISKTELAGALNALSSYVGKFGLGVSVQDNTLYLFAYTDDGSALARIPCNCPNFEWVYVDGTALSDVVKLADDDVLEMHFSEAGLSLKFRNSTSELRTLSATMPLDLARFCETTALIKGNDLGALSAMTEAASTDEARPNLKGVYLSAEGDTLTAAAADGYILSYTSINAENLTTVKGALYSAKALNRAKRAIKPSEDEPIAIGFGAGSITLSTRRDGVNFLCAVPRVGDGFPDFKAIVKGIKTTLEVQIETRTLDAFLKRASAMGGSIYMQVVNGFLWMMALNTMEERKSLDSVAVGVEGESPLMHYAIGLFKDVSKACAPNGHVTLKFPQNNLGPMLIEGGATVAAMPLMCELKESPFKDLQPALI